MLKSMTGFGRCETQEEKKEIKVEIKTVNHRYSDYHIRVPYHYSFLEEKIREYLKSRIYRGKVDIYINIDTFGDTDKVIHFDEHLAKAYFNTLQEISRLLGVDNDITASEIAEYNDVIKLQKEDEDQNKLWEIVKKPLETAVDNLISMREREGMNLKNDLVKRCVAISEAVNDIEARSLQTAQEHRKKLECRITELLGDIPIDENRILTEVAIFSDKISIDEEIVRLRSHLNEFEKILEYDSPIGKKLDFIIQEMNREINTIGSKANNLHVSKSAVNIKSEIENLREQVQNIE